VAESRIVINPDPEARVVIEDWRWKYNDVCVHIAPFGVHNLK